MSSLKPNKKSIAKDCISKNQNVEAKKILTKLCKRKGNDFDAWLLLALANRNLGLLSDASKCCQHVLNRNSNHSRSWHMLGTCHQLGGDIVTAINYYQKAIYSDSENENYHYYLANAYRESGDIDNAIKYYENAIKFNDQHLESLTNLGALLREKGDLQKAWNILNKAHSLFDNIPQVLCNLALIQVDLDNPDEALLLAQKAISIDKNFIDAYRVLGSVYTQKRDIDNALLSYETLLKLKPQDTASIAAISSILEKRNNFTEALRILTPLFTARTYNHDALITLLRLSDKIQTDNDPIALMHDYLTKDSTSDNEKIDLHYEFGRHYDKSENYTLAFEHYKEANELTKTLYDKNFEASSQKQILTKVPEWLDQLNSHDWSSLPVSTNQSKRPIFVIGLHRSGTSLIEQILSSHSSIFGAGELEAIPDISYRLGTNAWNSTDDYIKSQKALDSSVLTTAADEYLNYLDQYDSGKARVIDKQNLNYENIGLIRRLFPDAAIISISREPIDNCLSIYFQKFGLSLPYTTDLLETAEIYTRYNKFMDFWRNKVHIDMLHINYEDIVTNFESTTRNIINYCGLEWDENCLQFYKTKRDVNTPSYHQVRKPIYKKSLNRYKNYKEETRQLQDYFY